MANDAKKTPVTVAKPVMPAAAPIAAKTKKTAEKKTAKKTAAKKTTAKKTIDSKVYIQFFGKQVTASDVLASCEADYKSNNKTAIKNIEVYVKPEDDVAYYVVNGDVQGKVSL